MPRVLDSRTQSGVVVTRVRTVLLADDDSSLRSLLAAVVRREGYEVIEVGSGLEVLGYVEGSLRHRTTYPPVDMLVTDIHMPRLSGLDAMASLAAARCLPRTIVMTGAGSWEEHNRALALGAVLVLRRPFSLDEFRAAVAHGLEELA